MIRTGMSTAVAAWSFSSRAARLRLQVEVFRQFLLYLHLPLLLGLHLDDEVFGQWLLDLHLGDAAVVQRDGHVAHVGEPAAPINKHADNACYSRRQRYHMLQHVKQRACSSRLRGAIRQGTSWSAPPPGARPSRGCACREPCNTCAAACKHKSHTALRSINNKVGNEGTGGACTSPDLSSPPRRPPRETSPHSSTQEAPSGSGRGSARLQRGGVGWGVRSYTADRG